MAVLMFLSNPRKTNIDKIHDLDDAVWQSHNMEIIGVRHEQATSGGHIFSRDSGGGRIIYSLRPLFDDNAGNLIIEGSIELEGDTPKVTLPPLVTTIPGLQVK